MLAFAGFLAAALRRLRGTGIAFFLPPLRGLLCLCAALLLLLPRGLTLSTFLRAALPLRFPRRRRIARRPLIWSFVMFHQPDCPSIWFIFAPQARSCSARAE